MENLGTVFPNGIQMIEAFVPKFPLFPSNKETSHNIWLTEYHCPPSDYSDCILILRKNPRTSRRREPYWI